MQTRLPRPVGIGLIAVSALVGAAACSGPEPTSAATPVDTALGLPFPQTLACNPVAPVQSTASLLDGLVVEVSRRGGDVMVDWSWEAGAIPGDTVDGNFSLIVVVAGEADGEPATRQLSLRWLDGAVSAQTHDPAGSQRTNLSGRIDERADSVHAEFPGGLEGLESVDDLSGTANALTRSGIFARECLSEERQLS